MNHTKTLKISFASKLSVINVTMAYTMYKKPVTNPYTLETSGNLPVHSDILRVYRKVTGVFHLQCSCLGGLFKGEESAVECNLSQNGLPPLYLVSLLMWV